MNKCTIIGNVVRDPELRQTQSGTTNCSFSLAVNRKFKNANGEYETDFLNCVAWKGTAEVCGKYLHKGSKCAVCGSIQTRSYDDKNGVKRYATEILVEDVEFMSGGDKNASAPKEAPKTPKQTSFNDLKPVEDNDLLF